MSVRRLWLTRLGRHHEPRDVTQGSGTSAGVARKDGEAEAINRKRYEEGDAFHQRNCRAWCGRRRRLVAMGVKGQDHGGFLKRREPTVR